MPARSWSRVCRTVSWMARLSGAICTPSTAARGVAEFLASLPVSPALPSRAPESDSASRTSDGSGPESRASFARWDPGQSFLRTFPDSYLPTMAPPLERYSGTWPRSGMMLRGACSVRRRSVPRTGGNVFSSWPTPTSQDSIGSGSAGYGKTSGKGNPRSEGVTLTDATCRLQWPTPTVPNGGRVNPEGTSDTGMDPDGNKRQMDLAEIARRTVGDMWQTPATFQGKYRRQAHQTERTEELLPAQAATLTKNSRPLNEVASHCFHQDPATEKNGPESSGNAPTSRPQLNARFVEWLQGIPNGWTQASESINSGVWETWLFRQRRHLRSLLSRKG